MYSSLRPLFAGMLLLFTASVSAQSDVSERYELALQNFNNQNYKRAFVNLRSVLNDQPDHLPSKILMGNVLLLEGLVFDAGQEFEDALALGADPNVVMPGLLQVYLLQEDYDKVIQFNQSRLKKDLWPDVLLFKANAFEGKGNPGQAETLYAEALGLSSENRILNSCASFLLNKNRLADARELIEKAYSQDSRDVRTLQLFALLSSAEGKKVQALDYLRTAIQINPDDPIVQRSMLFSYLELNRLAEAKALVESILKTSPNDPMMQLMDVALLLRSGDTVAAEAALETLSNTLSILDATSDKSESMLPLIKGMTNFLKGDFEKSSRQLENYLKREKVDPVGISLLAQLYLQGNDKRRAKLLLESHLALIIKKPSLVAMLCNIYINASKQLFCSELLNKLDDNVRHSEAVIFAEAGLLRSQAKVSAAIELLEREFPAPRNDRASMLLIELYAMQGDWETALSRANALIESSLDNQAYLRLKADLLLSMNRPVDAEPLITRLLKKDPEHPDTLVLKARYLLQQKQIKNALPVLEGLYERKPNDEDIIGLLSSALAMDGNFQEAITRLEMFRKQNDESDRITRALAKVYTQSGNYSAALNEVEKLRRRYIGSTQYVEAKIDLLTRLNEFQQAKNEIARLELMLDDSETSGLKLVQYKKALNDYDGAISTLDKLLRDKPGSERVVLEKTRLQILAGKPDNAKQTLSSLLNTSSVSPAALFMAAKIAEQQEDAQAAYTFYERGFVQSDGQPLFASGMLSVQQQHSLDVPFADTVKRIMQEQPSHSPSLYYLLGQYYRLTDQRNEAEKILTTYINQREATNLDLALAQLAELVTDNNPQQANRYAKRAFELSPNNPAVLRAYGWSFEGLGNHEQALYHLRQALAFDASNSETLYKLAAVLSALSRNNEAQTYLEDAIRYNNPSRFAQKATALSEQLKGR
ncbi:tetratricopeptide repeat protein [Alteromonas sp. CYL-A6]|uniref:tetratricopeptide repeat protein n=1 Tax=Alteromonas nitratireducens TaxID=3390813 RepID=UPI0034BE0D40